MRKIATANVVDSSGWLEYFADSVDASFFAPALEDIDHLFVPVLTIYEVFKKVLRERGEDNALRAASMMQTGQIIDLNSALAMEAARYALPLADSIIYASALRVGATLWTQDEHFKGLPHVRFRAKTAAK